MSSLSDWIRSSGLSPSRLRQQIEAERCRRDPARFIRKHCWLHDATDKVWKRFGLWPAQEEVLGILRVHRMICLLKARQLGWSWLVVAYALHVLIFGGEANVLIFSKRDDEAVDLLDFRLAGMYERLPDFLWGSKPRAAGKHELVLSTGARAKAFPTTAGRSYTATLAIIDEADYVADLDRLLDAVRPTIDGGGQLVLLSSPDKRQPESAFKKIYRAAKQGLNAYHPVFRGWQARPDRTPEWYAEQKRDLRATTGSDDRLHERYPTTDTEALSANTLDKRISPMWLENCYRERPAIQAAGAPPVPLLEVYRLPVGRQRYTIGADPAQGNPTSNDSAFEVLHLESGEQVACLAGKVEPAVFASYLDRVGRWYNDATVMVERNNHGHAVLLWLHEYSRLKRLPGTDRGEGWETNTRTKAMLYDYCAEAFRERLVKLHSFATFAQLASIEGASLRAPGGMPDDRAIAFALATAVFMICRGSGCYDDREEARIETWR